MRNAKSRLPIMVVKGRVWWRWREKGDFKNSTREKVGEEQGKSPEKQYEGGEDIPEKNELRSVRISSNTKGGISETAQSASEKKIRERCVREGVQTYGPLPI